MHMKMNVQSLKPSQIINYATQLDIIFNKKHVILEILD